MIVSGIIPHMIKAIRNRQYGEIEDYEDSENKKKYNDENYEKYSYKIIKLSNDKYICFHVILKGNITINRIIDKNLRSWYFDGIYEGDPILLYDCFCDSFKEAKIRIEKFKQREKECNKNIKEIESFIID